MPGRHRHPLLRLVLTGLLLPGIASAAELSPEDLVDRMRDGGHVVYIRHASTESDYADQVTADPLDCATQRVLSRSGWQEARDIGDGFERLGIPVADVLSSQYCRAWQTADLAFGRFEERAELNFEPAEDYSEEQWTAMRDRVRPLMDGAPDGGNLVIVGHDDPFEAVTGLYPEPQGAAFVLRVDGDVVEVLGSIPPEAWPNL